MPRLYAIDPLLQSLRIVVDPRSSSRVRYRLPDVLLLAVTAVMAGCEGWDEIEDFCNDNLSWLRKYTKFESRGPCADTIRRVFERISPHAFRDAFKQWIEQMFGKAIAGHIAIDGKQLRSASARGDAAITILSAYATDLGGICLAQEAVAEKSNEINGIPKLLNCLELEGSIVTIDAIGCQHDILSKIVAEKGDYLVACKRNQASLHQDVTTTFEHFRDKFGLDQDVYETSERGHGREETRICRVISDISWLPIIDEWPGIQSIVEVESHRTCAGKTSDELRYYVSSRTISAKQFGDMIRSHWAIENGLHWVLDVAFNEDRIGVHDRIGAQNLALVRKIAFTLIKATKPTKMSFKRQAKRNNRRPDLLFQTLAQQIL